MTDKQTCLSQFWKNLKNKISQIFGKIFPPEILNLKNFESWKGWILFVTKNRFIKCQCVRIRQKFMKFHKILFMKFLKINIKDLNILHNVHIRNHKLAFEPIFRFFETFPKFENFWIENYIKVWRVLIGLDTIFEFLTVGFEDSLEGKDFLREWRILWLFKILFPKSCIFRRKSEFSPEIRPQGFKNDNFWIKMTILGQKWPI